jgi:hypothetical protein
MEEQLVAQHRLADRVIAQRAEPDGSLRYLAKARARGRRRLPGNMCQRGSTLRSLARHVNRPPSEPAAAGELWCYCRAWRAALVLQGTPPVWGCLPFRSPVFFAPVRAWPRSACSSAPAWRSQAGLRGPRARPLGLHIRSARRAPTRRAPGRRSGRTCPARTPVQLYIRSARRADAPRARGAAVEGPALRGLHLGDRAGHLRRGRPGLRRRLPGARARARRSQPRPLAPCLRRGRRRCSCLALRSEGAGPLVAGMAAAGTHARRLQHCSQQ